MLTTNHFDLESLARRFLESCPGPIPKFRWAIWDRTFDNSPRHCWVRADGSRVLDVNRAEPCSAEHTPNDKLVGPFAWRRFIAAANRVATVAQMRSPFAGDGMVVHVREIPNLRLETFTRDGLLVASILIDEAACTARVRLFDLTYQPVFVLSGAEIPR